MARSWELRYEARPWSLNQERSWHYHKRAKLVKEWRDAFCVLAENAGIPHLDGIRVTATPFLRGRQQDIGNCFPAAKAAVDGLVDAGVITDDTPEFFHALAFRHPVHSKVDSLVILVEEVECTSPSSSAARSSVASGS